MSQQYPTDPNQPQQPQRPPQNTPPQWSAQQQPYSPPQAAQYGQQPPQPPYQGPAPYQPPQAPKKKAGKIAGFGCLGALTLFVIVGIAASVGGSDDSSSKAADTSAAAPEQPAPEQTTAGVKDDTKPTAEDKPVAPPVKKTPAIKEYKEGDYIVGEDIPSGTYTSAGAKKGLFEFCSITTEPTSDATMPQIKSANADERIIITLSKADGVVTISNCEPLIRK